MAGSKLIYASIDLGTAFSGWAYSAKSDPGKVYAKTWYPHSGSAPTGKTPTCVILRQDGETLDCFGYNAERKFEELVADGDRERYSNYYFNDFKTKLYGKYNEPLDTGMTLIDRLGRHLPAINVFAASIKYLADDLFMALQKSYLNINREEIQWILTVPAIWTDQAKYMMRKSAVKAGLTSDNLIMALEPEAASVYCRQLEFCVVDDETGFNFSSLEDGSKYLVVDAGGGTIDLAIHEVTSNRGIRQVVASGGNVTGGNTVNREFEKFLIEVISESKFKLFKQTYTDDWLSLMHEFEVKKKYFDPKRENKVILKFPVSLKEVFISKELGREKSFLSKLRPKATSKRSFETAVTETSFGNDVSIKKDKMSFSADVFVKFFQPAIDGTIKQMKKQLGKLDAGGGVSCVLMVGGFSECTLLQQIVKTAFPDLPILTPPDASVAVLKGAVLYGHNPPVISERVVKYTYGVRSSKPFVKDHPFEKVVFTDSGLMCKDIFTKHVSRGELVKTDEPQKTIVYSPLNKRQTSVNFDICASKLLNPRYTTDKDCHVIGSVEVQLSETDDARANNILVSFAFGGTEITVTAVEEKTGNQVKTHITSLE